MKKILIVVGTRPNFIKITQFRNEALAFPHIDLKIVHTGQHFTKNMSDIFFEQFNLQPDYFLDLPASSPLAQIAGILTGLENLILTKYKPDLIITPGDVNSTLAVSIVANKLEIPLAHLESGLRSNDRSMPEEINRIITDELANYYFITEASGVQNLKAENKKGESFFVGNTMIDTVVAFESEIEKSNVIDQLKLTRPFVLMTIHRPVNVDTKVGLQTLLALTKRLEKYQLVFPIHPRTKNNIEKFGLTKEFDSCKNLLITDALGYFEFQKLIKKCTFILTDSGGIQEESTYRKIPCLTLRDSTERPITIDHGTNTLVDFDVEQILIQIKKIESGDYKKGVIPEFWDGKSTARILAIIDKMKL